jgi:hypothetical protein
VRAKVRMFLELGTISLGSTEVNTCALYTLRRMQIRRRLISTASHCLTLTSQSQELINMTIAIGDAGREQFYPVI